MGDEVSVIRIENATRGTVLATRAELAGSAGTRMKGLLGRTEFPEGEGLIIDPCNSIHTFFMAFAIDVVFVDGQDRVVRVCPRVVPWRLTRIVFRARKVIELPSGTLEKQGAGPGDQLVLKNVAPTDLPSG